MEKGEFFFNINDYKNIKEIGKGSFGVVYLFERISDGTQYAAKFINISDELTEREKELIMRETSILKILNHPGIVKICGVNFNSIEDLANCEPIILTRYLENGTLRDIFDKNINWDSTKKFISLLGITSAMRYLHRNKVLHRDLKPENILMDDNFYPYITDFGLSRCFSQSLSKSFTMTGNIGTPLYMAPEFYKSKRRFNGSVDIYSFGIIAYEIASGKRPYSINGKDISFYALLAKMVRCERPEFNDKITEPMKLLLTRCWSEDPKDRPTFDDIFNELLSSLSSNVSYIEGDIDIDEVQCYIDLLSEEDGVKIVEEDNTKIVEEYNEYSYYEDDEDYEKIDEQENDQQSVKIVEQENDEQSVKIVEREIDEQNVKFVEQENDEQNVKIVEQENDEQNVKIVEQENDEQNVKIVEREIDEQNSKIDEQEISNVQSNSDENPKTSNIQQLNVMAKNHPKFKRTKKVKIYEIKKKIEQSKKQQEDKKVSFPMPMSQIPNDNNNNNNQIYNSNSNMLSDLMENFDKIVLDDPYIKSVNGNHLHLACKLGNIDLFLLLLSLNKFDVTARTIFFLVIS